ncbi:MAG: type II secretion system protein [Candidatus Omnitrophota bacterium]
MAYYIKINKEKGFSLIEILIVSAILVIMSTIAIPALLRQRLNANERATIKSLKTLYLSLNSFAARNIQGGIAIFPANLDALTANQIASPEPPYLDVAWSDAAGQIFRSGYQYSYRPFDSADPDGTADRFWIDAIPAGYQSSGVRSFYVDEGGVVYGFDNAGIATGAYGIPAGWVAAE